MKEWNHSIEFSVWNYLACAIASQHIGNEWVTLF